MPIPIFVFEPIEYDALTSYFVGEYAPGPGTFLAPPIEPAPVFSPMKKAGPSPVFPLIL
jgi:hypothetical protein